MFRPGKPDKVIIARLVKSKEMEMAIDVSIKINGLTYEKIKIENRFLKNPGICEYSFVRQLSHGNRTIEGKFQCPATTHPGDIVRKVLGGSCN